MERGGKGMNGYIQTVNQGDEITSVIDGIEAGLNEQMISGLVGSTRSLFIATVFEKKKKSQLVVTNNLFQAQKLYDDLVSLIGEEFVYLYPVNELIASEIA